MKTELSAFDRRMEILSVLMNQSLISCLELSRRFQVSDDTIRLNEVKQNFESKVIRSAGTLLILATATIRFFRLAYSSVVAAQPQS